MSSLYSVSDPIPIDNTTSTPTSYAIEVYFMVAKDLPGRNYTSCTDASVGSHDDHRWSCPSSAPSPHLEILAVISGALVKNGESVTVHHDDGTVVELNRRSIYSERDELGSMGSWRLATSRVPKKGQHAPRRYDWVGVRLRSPMMTEETWSEDTSRVKGCLAALRLAARIYVNSTCPMNILVQPHLESGSDSGGSSSSVPLTLNASKRLATLIWFMEDKLVRVLSPPFAGVGADKFISVHSRLAKLPLIGVKASRPSVPACASALDRLLAQLPNDDVQERINTLWGATSLRELNDLLVDAQGDPLGLSFADADGAPTARAELRYTIWHPHGRYCDFDSLDHWIRFGILLLQWTQASPSRYHDFVSFAIAVQSGNVDPCQSGAVVRALMVTLGMEITTVIPLMLTVEDYKKGGRLGPHRIDRFPVLPPVESREDQPGHISD